MSEQPYCRCCGKPIAKKTRSNFIYVRAPNSTVSHGMDGEFWQAIEVDQAIYTKAECQRLTNQEVVSVTRLTKNGPVYRFGSWDGQSYEDDLFCTNACAIAFGRMAARKFPALRTQRAADAAKARASC